jgi:hypothetical protein
MRSRKLLLFTILALCLGLAGGIAFARTLGPIDRWLIGGGGGGLARGGNVSIYSAAGQPVTGAVAGGNVRLCSGFWCGGGQAPVIDRFLFLPLLMKIKQTDPYAPACSAANNYCENNDGLTTAYGPLGPGREYRAYPDDEYDYYYIELSAARDVTFRVSGFQTPGWLQIYDADDTSDDIGHDNNDTGGDGVMVVSKPGLAAGKYFVRVYNSGAANTSNLYMLKVDY